MSLYIGLILPLLSQQNIDSTRSRVASSARIPAPLWNTLGELSHLSLQPIRCMLERQNLSHVTFAIGSCKLLKVAGMVV